MRTTSIILLLGLLLTGGVTYYGGRFIRLAPALEEEGGLRLTGVIVAKDVIVAAQVTGRIRELTVDEGSWVTAGQAICDLEPREIEAEIRSHRARVDQLTSRVSQSEEVLSLERDRTRTQLAKAEAELQVAVAEKERGLSEQRQIEADLARLAEMLEEGIISRQEWERAQTRKDVSLARIRSLEDRIRAAEAELEMARANAGQVRVASMDVEQTRAQLEQETAVVTGLEARLSYTKILAPINGMVSVRVASAGEVTRAGDPIVTIVDLDDVWVRTDLEESYINRVRIGQTFNVRLATGEEIPGTVTFISPEAEFATQRDVNRVKRDVRTFAIKVRVQNQSRNVHPGMTAYVLIPPDESQAGRDRP